MRIFVDSDVIISSFMSQAGAAYFLLSATSYQLFISSLSKKELEAVVKRLGIKSNMLATLIENNLKVTMLLDSLPEIKESFKQYVLDENDAHILAGAKAAKADFLITYNVRDFKIDKMNYSAAELTEYPAESSSVNHSSPQQAARYSGSRIKKDFGILTLTPGNFLQYLRSIK